MILAGLVLLAIGAADLVRQFVPRRWIGYLVVVIVLLLLGSVSDALLPMAAALAAGALWAWSMPFDDTPRVGFWPAVALVLLAVVGVVWLGEREQQGVIGAEWALRSPFGEISFDLAVLVLGVVAFLLESSNLVVRTALSSEHTWYPADAGIRASAAGDTEPAGRKIFKGGRLIGPLERVIVFMLTLTAAYPMLAAMLAAKGIVRFPEISKDGETGSRAEYFLVGSLVSWVIALGSAFLVWWAVNS